MNIVLIGMRGAGKTWIGKKIAKQLDLQFIDTDAEIEKNEKMNISQIVEKHGWNYFREKENEQFSYFMNDYDLIIATGAGLVMDKKNQKLIEEGSLPVWIKTPPETMLKYLKENPSDHRPSLTGEAPEKEFLKIYKERKPVYSKIAHFILDTTKDPLQKEINKVIALAIF